MTTPTVSTPVGRVPVVPLVVTGIGVYLAWFAVHYWSSSTVVWPSTPVKDVLQGKGLPANSVDDPAAGIDREILGNEAAPASSSNLVGNPASETYVPGVSAGTYNQASLQALWTANGGAASTAFEAAQVALAESGGNAAVTSGNPDGGTNVGLWQLDTKGVGSGYTVAQLQDPDTNARITVLATANGTNWSQWADSVVVNGVYVGAKS